MNDNEEEIQDPVDMNQKQDVEEKKDDKKEDKKEENGRTEVDIAFVLDCTGSMNPYIKSAQDNIISIANEISEEEDCDVKFALVAYRDIPPQETTFITQIVNFTSVPLLIEYKLQKLEARGGGDAPEALTTALYKVCNNISWRKESIKIIIVIGDAPCHGLETGGYSDGFPMGDIIVNHNNNNNNNNNNNHDQCYNVIDILKRIRNDLNGSIYSVGCEPTLSCSFDFARDFYEYMSEYTHGRYLPLSDATLLPKVVIGSIKEQIMSYKLMKTLEYEMEKIKKEYGDNIDEDKMNELIAEKWKENGVKQKTVSIGTLYRSKRGRDNIDLLMNDQIVKSLSDFKKHCKVFPRPQRSDFRHLDIDKKDNRDRDRGRSRSYSRSLSKSKSRSRSRSRSGSRDRERERDRDNTFNNRDKWRNKRERDRRNRDRDRERDRCRRYNKNVSRSRSRSRSPQRVYVKSQALSNKDVGRVVMKWKSKNKKGRR